MPTSNPFVSLRAYFGDKHLLRWLESARKELTQVSDLEVVPVETVGEVEPAGVDAEPQRHLPRI